MLIKVEVRDRKFYIGTTWESIRELNSQSLRIKSQNRFLITAQHQNRG